jgi:hypothetical protein
MASLHLQRNSDSVTVKIRDEEPGIQLRTVEHYRLVLDGVEITEEDLEDYNR